MGEMHNSGLMVEATMQIPLLLAGAGLPAGEVREHLVSNLDLVPTLLDYCGVESEQNFHGRSLLPIITDSRADWRPGLLTQHYGLHEPITQRAWYQGDWKLVMQPDGYEELYRLSDDPGEMRNLVKHRAYRDKVCVMKEALYAAGNAYGDLDFPRGAIGK